MVWSKITSRVRQVGLEVQGRVDGQGEHHWEGSKCLKERITKVN